MFNLRVRYARATALAATVAATVALASCGNNNPNNVAGDPGKQLFTQNCGSCHVLTAAETKGTTGPNLDNAFRQSLESGMTRGTVESVVREQIALPMGGQMPANLVEGDDAEAVAAYVASVVGQAPKSSAAGGGSGKQAGSGGKQVDSGGKQAFTETCGSCHTLADAGTSGTTGPNLDQIKPNVALVSTTIKNGKGAMPPGLLSGKEAQSVADYVSSVAGK